MSKVIIVRSDETEPPPRPRGRPRVPDPLVPVSTRLVAKDHDRLIQLANKHDQSVAEMLRRIVQTKLR